MKKIFYLFLPLMALSACSTDAVDSENEFKSLDAKASNSKTSILAEEFIVPTETFCVDQEAEFTINAALNSNLQVQYYDKSTDEWIQIYQINKSTSNPQKFYSSWAEAGTYELRYKVGTGGFTDGFFVTVIPCGCTESFTYTDNGDASYTFTYIPAEDMDDAEVVFTFAQSVEIYGLEDWDENGQTRKSTMDLVACTSYSWTVGLEKICMGATTNNNVWTDLKVNDASKKGELPNITQSCN